MDKDIRSLTIRFDLTKPHDRRVWNHLHSVDKNTYHTMNRAVIEQLHEHFNYKDALVKDPDIIMKQYFERFSDSILEMIRKALSVQMPVILGMLIGKGGYNAADSNTDDTEDYDQGFLGDG